MFTKPLDQIEYADVKEFCRQCPEGESVEYTLEMPTGGERTKDIPAILSAFANTSGGILIIGVETDENNNAILPIPGVPSQPQMEERISQSAYRSISPEVRPEVRIVPNVPNEPGNVVVVVRVEKSLRVPHAIDKSTKVYIRVGSTTVLARIEKLEVMFKRRERLTALSNDELIEEGQPSEIGVLSHDSNQLSNRIFRHTQERIDSHWSTIRPHLTVTACPLVLVSPLIPTSELYTYMREQANNPHSLILFNDTATDFGTRQVPGGVCFVGATVNLLYREINEYGIVYHAEELHRSKYEAFHGPDDDEENQYLELTDFVGNIYKLIAVAKDFYKRCQFSGDIEVKARLQNVLGDRVMFGREPHYSSIHRRQSLEPEIATFIRCSALDLREFDTSSRLIVELVGKLLWGFNAFDDKWEEIVRDRINLWQKQYAAL